MSKTPVQIAVTYEQIGALKELADIANRVLAEAPADASYYSAFIDCEGVSHRLTLEQLRLLSSLPAALQSAADTPSAQETPAGYRWRGVGEWLYAPHAPEGVSAQALYLAPPIDQVAIDRIIPPLEPVSEDYIAEWALWQDRDRIRRELAALIREDRL